MLVLSRRRSERILIGTSIRITVVKLEGNQVRLGIEAPSMLPIMRGELRRRRRRRPDDRRPPPSSPEPPDGR